MDQSGAFIDSSANYRAGGITISRMTYMTLYFLRFRGCSSTEEPNGKDVYVDSLASTQFTSDMIMCCDSTSGEPNVCVYPDNNADSTLVPQIDPTTNVTLKSLHISFDGEEATVRVALAESIIGTMNVLLDGSNVPRVVNVVFGNFPTSSNLGKVVVSSGPNGVLPRADYVFRSAAVTGYQIIVSIGPFVFEASSTLKDWNTTEIVVSGANLKKGSYWMLVENGGKQMNRH
ncbi:hypothetical protein BLNAU_16700 [Blattamonas nauphoetae]|uniref:DUF4397 domain-containing protein n=1 Tax=Blattamonas nauphoetae TaxID=2049346 RepID=A0ABQ9XBV9_9EUKA|nr:hypothetical protein BLNAU_16700 [Blattamonas nauphoetae]